MIQKGKEFDDIFDLVAIRVIVDSVKDCYAALGSIHGSYKPVVGRFKDYIAMPKFNLYQSLHTTVIGPGGKVIEVQIRSRGDAPARRVGRRRALGVQGRGADARHRLAEPDHRLAGRRQRPGGVHGEPEDRPRAGRGLRVHAEGSGHLAAGRRRPPSTSPTRCTPRSATRCIGAKVNGRLVSLDQQLRSGDTCEIFTSKLESAAPSRDWLQFVVSPRARNKIRQWFSRERRVDMIEAGRDELTKEFRREGLPMQRIVEQPGPRQRDRGARLRRPRRAAGGDRREPRLGAIDRAEGRPRATASSDDEQVSSSVLNLRGPIGRSRNDRRRPRRGPRRRPDPPVEVLHAGARRRDHRLRHPRSWRVGAPRRLRQRREPDERAGGAADRRRVGRRPAPARCSGPASRSSPSTARGCCATSPTRSASSTSTSSPAPPTPAATGSPRCASSSRWPTRPPRVGAAHDQADRRRLRRLPPGARQRRLTAPTGHRFLDGAENRCNAIERAGTIWRSDTGRVVGRELSEGPDQRSAHSSLSWPEWPAGSLGGQCRNSRRAPGCATSCRQNRRVGGGSSRSSRTSSSPPATAR